MPSSPHCCRRAALQAVEVHLIVEDIEERLGEEQVEALLLAVAQNLPGKVPPMPR